MKRKLFHRLTSTLCVLALFLTLLPAASAAETPTSSRNINAQDYTTYGSTVKSYLYENSQGGVTRVEYTGGNVIVEDYDSAYALTNSRTIQAELPIWGGFFAGKDANFLIFGQQNLSKSDSAEVIRVVKYSKDWQRQGEASLNGANTTVPFDAGSLRCAEYGGYLYIRTCHEMYKSSDGRNHQSNLTMAVRQSDMTVTDSYYNVMNSDYGYISHSFNQFIIVDQDGKLVAIDHGDAYPRGVVFCKYYADAGTGKFTGGQYGKWCAVGEMLKFAGSVGNNTTGGSLGGLAETTDCYVMTYNYDGKGSTGPRDAYYHYMDKASGKSWSVKLTNDTPGVTTPVLAPMGLNGGYVLWNGKNGSTPNDTLYYLAYGANGTPSETKTAQAPLSDCQPIAHDGKAVWYVTNNSAPTFYGLDASGVTVLGGGSGAGQTPDTPSTPGTPSTPATPNQAASFIDVKTTAWYYQTVTDCAALGIVNGFEDGTFRPDTQLTGVQFISMLTRTFYADELNQITTPAGQPWYYPNTAVASDLSLDYGVDFTNANMNRYDMAQTLYNIISKNDKALSDSDSRITSAQNGIKDYSKVPSNRQIAVKQCYALGIITGMDDGTFSGGSYMTRAQACTVIMRMLKLINS